MPYEITINCIGCGSCSKKCPENAIEGEIKSRFTIDPYICTECGTCFNTCRKGAVNDPSGNRSPGKNNDQKDSKALIDKAVCAGCKNCFMNCPQDAIKIVKKSLFSTPYCAVNEKQCIGCATCLEFCITGAVMLVDVDNN